MEEAAKGPGRPAVSPGEPSIKLDVTMEVSLYRRLRLLAQARRELSEQDLIRSILRRFANENK